MTRKDYVNAALLLKTSVVQGAVSPDQGKAIAKFLSAYFKGDNARFDKAKFFNACGLDYVKL